MGSRGPRRPKPKLVNGEGRKGFEGGRGAPGGANGVPGPPKAKIKVSELGMEKGGRGGPGGPRGGQRGPGAVGPPRVEVRFILQGLGLGSVSGIGLQDLGPSR